MSEDLEQFKVSRTPIYIGQVIKGVALNLVNPVVLVFWIVTCTTVMKGLKGTGISVWMYFSFTIGTMFAIDLLKIFFASRLKAYMTPAILNRISFVIGLIMIVGGIYIMCKQIELPMGIAS